MLTFDSVSLLPISQAGALSRVSKSLFRATEMTLNGK
jgi:hypothetical protein